MKRKGRPSVLDDYLVSGADEKSAAQPVPVKRDAAANAFRTSVYFPRAVHDRLRAIAFDERKTVSDLIFEGLDHVLTTRSWPTTSELGRK